ncbi:MAG TPA: menaquinone biosynthesis protein, partial [Tepidisphaeraceae bacterium]|nr:menaquinone biosynthesis protein [Tepidisphaeraceae bacterium]
INARPLNAGLYDRPDVSLTLDVPSRLIDHLAQDRADIALLPVIDYQRLDGLTVLPAAGIGCDGPTLTVRLFSRTPIESTKTLACDLDSHTSVVLARIILSRRFGIRPEFIPLDRATGVAGETRLLIGDKVVCEEPVGFDYQLDLGEAWKDLTDLPFVFAVWCARSPDIEAMALLEASKRTGLAQIEQILTKFAEPRGWPRELARRYLTEFLKFDIGPRQLEAIRLFHRYAHEEGAIDAPRELKVLGPSVS